MRKIYTLFVLIFLTGTATNAQIWQWGKNAGNFHTNLNAWDRVTFFGIATDRFNNVYSTGTFIDTLQFVDTTIISTNTQGTRNQFIIKYDESGNRKWVRVLKGSFNDNPMNVSNSTIRVDNNGDIIFSGFNRERTVFGQPINEDYFLCKMKQDGTIVWVRTFRNYVRFTLDQADNIYVHLAVAAGNPGTLGTMPLNDIPSYAVGKMNPSGVTQWIKQYPSSSSFNLQNSSVEVNPSGSELLFSSALLNSVTFDGSLINVSSGHSVMVRLNTHDGMINKIMELKTNAQARISHAQWANDSTIVFAFSKYLAVGSASPTVNNVPIPFSIPLNTAEYIALAAVDSGGTTVHWSKQIYTTTFSPGGYSAMDASVIAVKNDNVYLAGAIPANSQINNIILSDYDICMGFLARFDRETGDFINFTKAGARNSISMISGMAITDDETVYVGGNQTRWGLASPPEPIVLGTDSMPRLGNAEFFIGKITGNSNVLNGRIYADLDNDGSFSGYDAPVPNVLVNHQPSNSMSSSHLEGYYQVNVDTGNYTLTPVINIPQFFDVAPASHNGNLPNHGNQINDLDFRLVPLGSFREVSIDITQMNSVRAGSTVQYLVHYKNSGTSMASGDYSVAYDNRFQFLSSDSSVFASLPDSLVFQYTNLAPFESRRNVMTFSTGTSLTFTDTLNLRSTIFPVTGDTIPTNNVSTMESPVFGPFDPNQKTILPKESILIGDAQAGLQEIEYTLQFQNTGNDTAFHVIVTDSLSALLNVNSLQVVSSSHPFNLNLLSNNLLEFRFMNIMLVDSFQNEPKSHGFVKFRIKTFSSVSLTDTVYNNCNIFFDYNQPITTNTVKTFFITPVVPPVEDSVSIVSFRALKNNNESLLDWITDFEQHVDHYSIERSADSINFLLIGQKPALGSSGGNYFYTDATPVSGKNFYRIKAVYEGGGSSYSTILMVDHTPLIVNSGFHIAPVPAKNHLRVNIGNVQMPARAIAYVYDNTGRLLIKNVTNLNGAFYDIDVSHLSSGMYFIKVEIGGKVYEKAFIK